MNTIKLDFGIRDILLLTSYVAILLTLFFCNEFLATLCAAAVFAILWHYARRFTVLRGSGLYLSLGALAGYVFCEIFFQVPFFFMSPRLGLICLCMILGATFGVIFYLVKVAAKKSASMH